jgi:hypothetical protein
METISTMIIGCGEKGAAWAAKKTTPEKPVISLDKKRLNEMREPFIIGDVFNLQVESNSINKIYADFIINGIKDREITAQKILNNPDLLDTDNFPPLVRDWYTKELKGSHDLVRDNITEVNVKLKTAALREMWRVLAPNGSLEILDLASNIEWIKRYSYKIIQDRPLLLRPKIKDITSEDFERSASLGKVIRVGKVQKIELVKLPVEATASLVGS